MWARYHEKHAINKHPKRPILEIQKPRLVHHTLNAFHSYEPIIMNLGMSGITIYSIIAEALVCSSYCFDLIIPIGYCTFDFGLLLVP